MLSIDEVFKGRHFDRAIIIVCVRCVANGAATKASTSSSPTCR